MLLLPFYTSAQGVSNNEDIDNLIKSYESQAEATVADLKEQIRSQTTRERIDIKISPKNPNPYEEVSIELVSYLTDFYRAEFSWYLDGKLKEKGIGEDTFSFVVGGEGDITKVRVLIKTEEGDMVIKRFNFNPTILDVLWEADTYVPPFYKGKALASPESWVKIVVIPHFTTENGNKLKPSNLIYEWRKKNGEKVKEASGYGKNTFLIEAPIPFGNSNIEVFVSSLGNSLSSTKKIVINPTTPEIIFYEDNPIKGIIYENSIKNESDLSKQEITIKATPYFFANDDIKAGNITYEWLLGGNSVVKNDTAITLRREEGGRGRSLVGFTAQNIAKTFQSASKTFVLNFKKTGLFNF